MRRRDTPFTRPPGAEDDTPDEADLWFLPGPDPEEDVPPGAVPVRPSREGAVLFDPQPWREAQAALAPELAELAGLFGALDQRLRGPTPQGWRMRLALREVSDLSWWAGDRLGADRIALWVALRAGSTDDTEQALARAGWAVRHLSSGGFPSEGVEAFLERVPRPADTIRPGTVPEAALGDLAEVLNSGVGLHPVVAAARLFQAWRALGPPATADIEAAVLAARHAASAGRRHGEGALFLPLAQTGPGALRSQGAPGVRLAAWLGGAERAALAALLHLDRLADWQLRAENLTRDLSGRTPAALIPVLVAWPMVTAPMAEKLTAASRAAVQRNLAIFESRGLVREVTGQGRYRVWTALP